MDKPTGHDWRPVVGWEDLYEVSGTGLVWSTRSQRLLKQPRESGGYPRVALCLHGCEVTRKVPFLVAEAFLGLRPEGLQVRHLDGNKMNNAVTNLAYGTGSENILDTVRHGTHHAARRTACANGHEYTPENTYITPNGRRNCRECNRIRAKANGPARRSTTRRKGHRLAFVERGNWACTCGVPLGSTQREARKAILVHSLDLRDAPQVLA